MNSFDFGFSKWLPKKVKVIKKGKDATIELEMWFLKGTFIAPNNIFLRSMGKGVISLSE